MNRTAIVVEGDRDESDRMGGKGFAVGSGLGRQGVACALKGAGEASRTSTNPMICRRLRWSRLQEATFDGPWRGMPR